MTTTYCPRCLRSDAAMPNCPVPDFRDQACPEPLVADPTKSVHVVCGPCGVDHVVPLADIFGGRTKSKLPMCNRSECACTIVPAPIADAVDPEMPEVKKAQAAKPKA